MPAREGVDARLTLKAVETGGTTAAQTILPQGIHSCSLDLLVASEPGEVVASQVEHSLSGRELRFGTGGTDDDRNSSKVGLLLSRERLSKRLWCPLVDELVDFLRTDGYRTQRNG